MSTLEILENYSLLDHNTFDIDVEARFFTTVSNLAQLREVLTSDVAKANKLLVLGGGSNILFTENFNGLVIHNIIDGIELSNETGTDIILTSGSGEIWHNLVRYALSHNLGGIENLSLIPGSVGAAPIQNIGAYGVELKETLLSVKAVEIETGELRTFNNSQCKFGYRDSIFKSEAKDKYVITEVAFRLSKKPEVNIAYGAIKSVLEDRRIEDPTINDVSQAIIEIRKSKLPDPEVVGNAGSFFKNPIIKKSAFEKLKLKFQNIPGFDSNGMIKVPAAWLIEQCGWKGMKVGNIGVHENQPLVLVNYGGGKGHELVKLADDIKRSVYETFDISLEAEPRVI